MKSNINKHGKEQIYQYSRKKFLITSGLFAGCFLMRPFSSVFANRNHYDEIQPWPLKIEGDQLIIPSGDYLSELRTFRVKKGARFRIKPATISKVTDEALFLSADKPSGYWVGTPLKGPRYAQLGVYQSLIEDSLIMKDSKGSLLKKGDDYLVSSTFALVGLGTNTTLTSKEKVYASYSYYQQRIDTVYLDKSGVPFLLEGKSSLVSPAMPKLPAGAVRFCNIYRPILANSLKEDHLFPILSDSKNALTETTKGRINKTLEKLKAGKTVNIVAWGDSITVGADVKPGEGWADLLHAKLKEKFPKAKINYTNHSIGGTRSMQWLHNGDFPDMPKLPADKCSFDLVANDKPDLVVMEFTNDTVLPNQNVLAPAYELIKSKMNDLGAELIICTPGRFLMENYDTIISKIKKSDDRPYVPFVKKFAAENKFAIADTSSRWDQLYKEGIPYPAIFINAYNHPDAFGHTLFVEEQLKCFE